jgi:hypothetical protein
MRAGDGPQHGNEHEQDRSRRQRIAKQRQGKIPARQALGHDAGTDDRSEQECGAKTFSKQPL